MDLTTQERDGYQESADSHEGNHKRQEKDKDRKCEVGQEKNPLCDFMSSI